MGIFVSETDRRIYGVRSKSRNIRLLPADRYLAGYVSLAAYTEILRWRSE